MEDFIQCDYCGFEMEWLDECDWCGVIYCEYCGEQGAQCCHECNDED